MTARRVKVVAVGDSLTKRKDSPKCGSIKLVVDNFGDRTKTPFPTVAPLAVEQNGRKVRLKSRLKVKAFMFLKAR